MTEPIKPEDIGVAKAKHIPDFIIDIVNNLIIKKWCNGCAIVLQKDIVDEILKSSNYTRAMIFDNHYLDIEYAYRSVGWQVEYDKPGFNESYDAIFRFTKGKK